ncbi:matrixin family metalloprotease [Aeoliella mucimassa]|uniref:Matrixin n=1 Tax=Aeoliella mucimassa TaxID=2527972 RepID=A0A518AIC4_9BACT|nr:matrixin family metalloprotease [Aeoliella mucimassa]QDU54495.1 Matrixin [Aeoliella mucimassa]
MHPLARTLGIAICYALLAPPAWGFVPVSRWGETASHAETPLGKPATITWSLLPDGTPLGDGQTSELVGMFDTLFGITTSDTDYEQRAWFPLVSSTFDRWAELGGANLVYESVDDGTTFGSLRGQLGQRGDIRLGGVDMDGPRGTLGTSQYPQGGDILIDTLGGGYLLDPADNYLRFRNVLTHEIGHALGFGHVYSSDAHFLMESELDLTIDGPQFDDIRALHYYYGDHNERTNNGLGNDTLSAATSLGTLASGTRISIGDHATTGLSIEIDETDFVSISNSSDRDFYHFSVEQPGTFDLLLTPLGESYFQGTESNSQAETFPIAASNLSFSLYDGQGTRLLTIDEFLHGSPEQLNDYAVSESADYYIEVRGTRQSPQLYQVTLTHHALMVPEPSSLFLVVLALGMLLRKRNA